MWRLHFWFKMYPPLPEFILPRHNLLSIFEIFLVQFRWNLRSELIFGWHSSHTKWPNKFWGLQNCCPQNLLFHFECYTITTLQLLPTFFWDCENCKAFFTRLLRMLSKMLYTSRNLKKKNVGTSCDLTLKMYDRTCVRRWYKIWIHAKIRQF